MQLEQWQTLPEYYCILELSSELKLRQQQLFADTAPQFLDKIRWLDRLPDNFVGVVLGNEVIDAMPVHQFIMQDKLYEIFVKYDQQHFIEHMDEPCQQLVDTVNNLNIDFPKVQ